MSWSFIFFNSVNRLRSGWRFSIFVALFIVLAMALLSFASLISNLLGASLTEAAVFSFGFLIQFVVLLFAAILVGWICAKGLESLPFASLGCSLRDNWFRDLVFGFVFGAISLLLAAFVGMLSGGLSFTLNQTATSTAIANTLLTSALIFALGAASEEALFRGYALQTFVRARLVWVAILITSVVFAVAHTLNPNVTALGLVNTALAGVWFVIAYMKTRNLWFPFGLHWAWNWTMGAVLGIPVSGIEQLTPHPLLNRIDTGPTWLTGGHYGLEGGAACTIALIASTLFIWFAPFLKPTAEMLALTSKENAKKEKQTLLPPVFGETLNVSSTDNGGNFER